MANKRPPLLPLGSGNPYLRGIRLAPPPDEDKWPYTVPAVRALIDQELSLHSDVTFFVGENGSGKSTVLEAIASKMNYSAEGGTRHMMFESPGPFSPLHEALKLIRTQSRPKDGFFLRAESFYRVADLHDSDDPDNPTRYSFGVEALHEVSHGEAFMATLNHKLLGGGLYLFDEPEAALSPQRQLAALGSIHQLVKEASQFIIATHSPILLAYPRAKIYLFDTHGIRETAYEDTEHYQITRDFLNHRERTLRYLLQDEEFDFGK